MQNIHPEAENADKRGINVLLIYANSPMDNLIPIGVSILSACLKKGGHNVKLFDTTFYKTNSETGDDVRTRTLQVKKANLNNFDIKYKSSEMDEDFLATVDDFKPDLIGASCAEPTLNIALKLLDLVKERDIPKAIGGMGVMFLAGKVIQNDCIDIVCIGEGEKTIVELADAIKNKTDYSCIKNLWVKKNGEVIKNEIRPLVDINDIPFPDWSIFENQRFLKPMGGVVRRTGTFEFARGCPRMCTYCCNWGVNKFYKGKYVRRKSVDRLICEIKNAKKEYNLEYAYFCAENFLLGLKEEEFNKFITEYEKIKLPFWIETEPGSFNEDMLRKLKMVGCEGISIGVEHGNEAFRKKVLNRNFSNQMLIESFDMAKKAGIRVSANNIIGLPDETRELIFDTIRLNKQFGEVSVIVNLFTPFNGTRLREIAVEKGYIEENQVAGDYRTSSILNQPQLSSEELQGLHRTFVMYVKFPESKWELIKKAEQFNDEGNIIFNQLTNEYIEAIK